MKLSDTIELACRHKTNYTPLTFSSNKTQHFKLVTLTTLYHLNTSKLPFLHQPTCSRCLTNNKAHKYQNRLLEDEYNILNLDSITFCLWRNSDLVDHELCHVYVSV